MFWLSKLPGWIEQYGPVVIDDIQLAQKILGEIQAAIEAVKASEAPTVGAEKMELPSILQVSRSIFAWRAKRHLVSELTATGKMTEAEAQKMVDDGSVPTTAATETGAAGGFFANILSWLQANGPTIAADIAAAIPVIIQLLSVFSALGL